MSPMSNKNLSSNYYGEDVASRVNVLASCYIVDTTAQLKGVHYCTTGVTGTFYTTLHFLPHFPFNSSRTDCVSGAEWYS